MLVGTKVTIMLVDKFFMLFFMFIAVFVFLGQGDGPYKQPLEPGM